MMTRGSDRARADDKATAPIDTTTLVASPGSVAAIPTTVVAPNAFAPVLDRAWPSVVKVYGAGGFVGIPAYGTGIVVDSQGFVLTAWSVSLEAKEALKVVTNDGRRFAAQLWRADPARGVAVLKIDAAGLPALALADSAGVAPGDIVLTIGNAFDVAYGDEKPAAFAGYVVAIGALDVRLGIDDAPSAPDLIIIDAPNNPGTQGGPLFARDGRLLGVLGRLVEAKATNTQVHFAVPANAIRDFVKEAIGGRRDRPTPPFVERHAGAVETGLRLLDAHLSRSPPAFVEHVVPGSPADKAGLKPDDLIFRADGRVVRSCRAFEDLLRAHVPGDRLKLVVKRGESMVALELELASRDAKKEGG